jgi:hypothetical protein
MPRLAMKGCSLSTLFEFGDFYRAHFLHNAAQRRLIR